MSRSYKKTPWCGERKGKLKKRMANHKVRQTLKRKYRLRVKGNAYKKLYETWNICDFSSICSWEEYWQSKLERYNSMLKKYPYRKIKKPDKKESYRYWLKVFRNK